ncbi:MAG: S-layer protein, partial [Planctomycetes bacterium]|nr:S-layer protein [Planctomycetota bacterium]
VSWKIIKTNYPTADTVVAGFNVLDFDAKADGRQDCTESFQKALDSMRDAGGGTVFVPQGRYVIKGTLRIPVSVTLRGEWAAPTQENLATRGTILMVYAGRGQTDGTPFITVDYCGGVKDMSFWYPEQDAKDIVPYPYCLVQKDGDNATFENLTLVNPYHGIRIGPRGNELHYVHNVYGTPLKVGIRYDSTTDIGRLENVHFSPDYWCQSGLANAPSPKADFASWLLANGTAVHMERSDWEYVSYVSIDGYNQGYLITRGARGAANAQFYNLIIRNCKTAVHVEETNPFGMVFSKCTFEGIDYGFRIGKEFNAAILLSNCQVSAALALHSLGAGNFIIQNSRVTNGEIHVADGVLAMTDSQLPDPNTRILFGSIVKGASLIDTTFARVPPWIKSNMPSGKLKITSAPVKMEAFPEYDGNQTRIMRPAKDVLYVVTDALWGANGNDKQDDTLSLQKALDYAGKNGGGIVFVPAGDYILRGSLSVPSGVELRGIHDVPHHTIGNGSLLHVYPGTGRGPAVTVHGRAGLRGLSFNYPEQDIQDVKKYPYLIQGNGEDLYVINVNCANPYCFLDLMTNPCHRHYIDYLSGSPLGVGVAVGGSSSQGEVRNTQFNPHYWNRCNEKSPFFQNRPGAGRRSFRDLWNYQKENLDALWVGNCSKELLFQNFVYGSLYGIHFTQQGGKGPEDCIVHGHGTDGSKVGVFFEHGSGRIDMINSELVAMSSQDKVAIKLGAGFGGTARLINTLVWGSPDTLAQVDGGQLCLQGLHAFHHGNGLQINRGEVRAFNINYYAPGSHADIAVSGAAAKLIGCITKGPLIVNKKQVEKSSNPTQMIVIGNVDR